MVVVKVDLNELLVATLSAKAPTHYYVFFVLSRALSTLTRPRSGIKEPARSYSGEFPAARLYKALSSSSPGRDANHMRILIALAPLMYRQTLALTLKGRRPPHDEVLIAAPQALNREASRFHPHLVVCNDNASEVEVAVPCWVVIRFHDGMDATVSISGQSSRLFQDIGIDDLLEVIDETERVLLRG